MTTTDIHFHLPAVESDGNGIVVSERIRSSLAFHGMVLYLKAKLGEVSNASVAAWSRDVITRSERVDKTVVLAFDGNYKADGSLDMEQTDYFIANDVVSSFVAACSEKALFGASVNLNRPDAIKALEDAHGKGAVLVKVIPSSQRISLADAKHRDFFTAMAAKRLPLLCHMGVEHTIPPPPSDEAGQALNNVSNLEALLNNLLEWNVKLKVIAAHCALPNKKSEVNKVNNHEELLRLVKRPEYTELLYADVSAFFFPVATPYRRKLARRVATDKRWPHERLILGSDFPVSAVMEHHNPLDANVDALCREGFDECILSNAEKVLP